MRILRNALSNMAGSVLPAIVLIVTTPIMVARLGLTDYGLLTIISAVAGYFSIIDVNFTAGSLKYLAEYHTLGDQRRVSQTIMLGLLIYGAIGMAGGAAIWVFADPLASHVFDIPADQLAKAHTAFRIAAISFLVGQLQAYLNSLPQSLQRYDISARLEAGFGSAVPIVSVFVLLMGGGLVEVLEVRLAASVLHSLLLVLACRRLFSEFRPSMPEARLAKTIMGFSGYAYLSKVASLSYAHADRLIIGSLLGMEAVTLYSVPATVISRCMGMSFRLSQVVFPAASSLAALNKWDELKSIYMHGARYINFINGCTTAMALLFGRELLHYWIGGRVASEGYWVFVAVALAMFADSLTNLPSLVNDGLGHARTSGRFAILRAIVGVLACFVAAVLGGGIIGVAFGHLLASIALGAVFLIFVHRHNLPYSFVEFFRQGIRWPAGVVLVCVVATILRPEAVLTPLATIAYATLSAAILCLVGSLGVLDAEHRRRVFCWGGIR